MLNQIWKVKMKKLTLLLAFVCAVFGADFKDFTPFSGTINIAGGTAHIPVMNEAAKNIMRANPKITITIAGGGSGVGVKQVGEGLVDIGNTGRALKQGEIEQYGLVSYPFAIDGVAVAMHPSNKISDLTTQQVKEIFSGKITNWKELGGDDAAINLYTREDGSGTREVFVDKFLEKGEIALKANIISSNGAMKTAISSDKNAIGYIGIGHIDAKIKAADIDGVTPTQQNAKEGKYKVTRLLYMNTKGAPTPLVGTFIEYITKSEDGKKIIKNAGYIPLD